jgi:hypothetical protein
LHNFEIWLYIIIIFYCIQALCQTYLNCDNQLFQAIAKYSRVNKSKHPLIIVGYSDGTVRVFDIDKANIICKMHPLSSDILAIESCENSKKKIK